MTKVVALQTWSNGTITMDEKSVLDIDDALATDLIAKGIVADAAMYFGGGGSGGGVLVVTDTDGTLDKTWQEIYDAMLAGGAVVSFSETDTGSIVSTWHNNTGGQYLINVAKLGGTFVSYTTSTASGYPAVVSAGGGSN